MSFESIRIGASGLAAAGAAAAAGKRSWMGPIAGLAAGADRARISGSRRSTPWRGRG